MNLYPDRTFNLKALKETPLPPFEEWAYDIEEQAFKTRNGSYFKVTENEALKIWIYKALKTQRYRYRAYSWKYGSEFEELIGFSTNHLIMQNEIKRYIEEALLVNPYIVSVENFDFTKLTDVISVRFDVISVYGSFNTVAVI